MKEVKGDLFVDKDGNLCKDYDCIVDGAAIEGLECIDCKGSEKDAFEVLCTLVGGSVEKK